MVHERRVFHWDMSTAERGDNTPPDRVQPLIDIEELSEMHEAYLAGKAMADDRNCDPTDGPWIAAVTYVCRMWYRSYCNNERFKAATIIRRTPFGHRIRSYAYSLRSQALQTIWKKETPTRFNQEHRQRMDTDTLSSVSW